MMQVCGWVQNAFVQPVERAVGSVFILCRKVRQAVSDVFLLFCRWWAGGGIDTLPCLADPVLTPFAKLPPAPPAPLERRDLTVGVSECPPDKQSLLSVFAAIEDIGPRLREETSLDFQRALDKGKTIASILQINARDVAIGTMYPHFTTLNIHYFPSLYEVGLRSDHLPELIERVRCERPGEIEDLAIFVTQGTKHHAFALFEKEGRWWLFDPVGHSHQTTILFASYATLADVQTGIKQVLGAEDGYFEVLPVGRWHEPQLR